MTLTVSSLGFLHLPPEIRNMIYEEFFRLCYADNVSWCEWSSKAVFGNLTSLSLTNHEVHDESRTYCGLVFLAERLPDWYCTFRTPKSFVAFTSILPPSNWSVIRGGIDMGGDGWYDEKNDQWVIAERQWDIDEGDCYESLLNLIARDNGFEDIRDERLLASNADVWQETYLEWEVGKVTDYSWTLKEDRGFEGIVHWTVIRDAPPYPIIYADVHGHIGKLNSFARFVQEWTTRVEVARVKGDKPKPKRRTIMEYLLQGKRQDH